MRALLMAANLLVLSVSASAQNHSHGQYQAPTQSGTSPYAEFRTRPIKALSQQQKDDLLAGRGMGLALAAEMNDHPGPMHVLEHAERLQLTAVQRQTMEALMHGMRRNAIVAGEALIAAEAELDRLFASATIDDARLATQISAVSQAQGEVRRIHLATHITARAALTAEQIALYGRLRGYAKH